MPSALKFMTKKGRPKIGKKKNKMYSLAKRKGNRHVNGRMLDNMLSPVFSITKKDYGYSTVHDDGGASSTELPEQGNLSSVQALAGRQIYLEFMALPIRNLPVVSVSAVAGLPTFINSVYKRTFSFIDLLHAAFLRNRTLVQNTNKVVDPSAFLQDPNIPGFNIPAVAFNATYTGTFNSTNTIQDFVENVLSNAAFNFKFCYMGGHQTHRIMNTTTLPIHIEIREFRPRFPMAYDLRRRQIGAYGNYDCGIVPGLYQTMYADRIRIMNRDDSSILLNDSAHGLYDDIDDRNFKYLPQMEETNFRWVVGAARKATIYPGETFTYKMVLPPFSGDSFQFVKNLQRKWTNLGNNAQAIEEWGVTPTLAPGFTKHCQIRIIGSRAYSLGKYEDNSTNDPIYTKDGNNDAYPGTGTMNPSFNNDRPIDHVATHGPRITHTVTEHHSMRTFPSFDGRVHIFTDETANAETGNDISRSTQMAFIDPMENGEELIPGDG